MDTFRRPLLHLNLLHRFAVLLIVFALTATAPGVCAPIHDAARSGDLAKVKSLLAAHPDLLAAKDDQYGQTPLHIAAFNDRKDVVEFLLASKADVNAKAKNGSTPLHLAAAAGHKDIVELLLNAKADIDALDNEGWSPAHSAVTWNQPEIKEFLIAKGGTELPAPKLPPAPKPPAAPKEVDKEGDFTAYDDGTVLNAKAKLMWSGRDNGSALNWPDAKKYAADYRGGGYSDWRLPTPEELSALFDKTKTHRTFCAAAVTELGVAADDVHVPGPLHLSCPRIWTSEERSDKPGSATLFDFHSGSNTTRPTAKEFIDTASRVLLVRDLK